MGKEVLISHRWASANLSAQFWSVSWVVSFGSRHDGSRESSPEI